jgi:hypothetical protein
VEDGNDARLSRRTATRLAKGVAQGVGRYLQEEVEAAATAGVFPAIGK